ncbi:MAG: hypothetical protein A3J48_00115 [Candidatus Doudnabacteria bacterium RIFCSPHIGHO2_02_FULL_46_11]|uniref:Uncharacterized protein n=1 Tax=Candidatus Doudnabacteria bacterium RIFCSPHIGHO2_02_FULL_46_11 TaxID=1817832 RepID=A0A1F5P9D6_9BACT|nr:MAG: hypothetical protein A3J48_00115 [Candidatus Doudnabacteria bacterium RIFCSPHIGHO2_02_FULL_46_11]
MIQSTQTVPQLSSAVIPAVRGEFYSYSAQFTLDTPLYCMLKCKANKSRPVGECDLLAGEVDLVFVFGDDGLRMCSADSQFAAPLIGRIKPAMRNPTWISPTNLSNPAFEQFRERRDGRFLAGYCNAQAQSAQAVTLMWGAIYAIKTRSGKYGLIRVTEITASSVCIDACHILL